MHGLKRAIRAAARRAGYRIERLNGGLTGVPDHLDVHSILGMINAVSPNPNDRRDLARFLHGCETILAVGEVPMGQLAQDAFALAFGRTPGVFLDIGAAHPSHLSNTYVLQSAFGWSGVLVEPNPQFAQLLRQERQTERVTVIEAALASNARRVDFLPAAEFGTFAEHIRSDEHAHDRLAATRELDLIEITTLPVREMLATTGLRRIDFLTVDTEGSELEILGAIPFDEVEVSAVAVEHNYREGHEDRLTELLAPFGYRRVLPTLSAWDAWYVRDRE